MEKINIGIRIKNKVGIFEVLREEGILGFKKRQPIKSLVVEEHESRSNIGLKRIAEYESDQVDKGHILKHLVCHACMSELLMIFTHEHECSYMHLRPSTLIRVWI